MAQNSLIDPELLEKALGAGASGIDAATGAAGLDLQDLASQKSGLLKDLLKPQEEQARSNLQAKLLAQGRLGSTGGGVEQTAVEQAILRNQMEAELAGLDLARQERQDQFGMGLGLAELGIGTNVKDIGFGLEREGLDLARDKFEFEKRAAKRKRGGFLSGLLGGLAPAVGTALGGPIGGMIGGLFGAKGKGE